MIGYDEPYITPCGAACCDWAAYNRHKNLCEECAGILFRDYGIWRVDVPENDADDRGICYEDDLPPTSDWPPTRRKDGN